MKNLLSMPVRPVEVMIAKTAPYFVIGYAQVAMILVASVSSGSPHDLFKTAR